MVSPRIFHALSMRRKYHDVFLVWVGHTGCDRILHEAKNALRSSKLTVELICYQ